MNARARGDWQGMNWIRQEKRLAIYLRDGCACVWCGSTLEDGIVLTLDHLTPHSVGGTNDENNLITACKHCNDSRGARSVVAFAKVVADYVGVKPAAIVRQLTECIARGLDMDEARKLIARRGSAARAVQSL